MKEEFGAKARVDAHALPPRRPPPLTKPQPINIVRTTLQALSAVLGGTQSLHTNGLDEAYTIPSEYAMKVALRTQQKSSPRRPTYPTSPILSVAPTTWSR